jgi:hypothetical protein
MPPLPGGGTAKCRSSVLCLLPSVLCLFAGPAAAQERGPQALRLDRLVPAGARSTATESWGAYDVGLTNLSDADRRARVLLSYDGQPDVQYGRDLWVPARSTLLTWALVGPAPADGPQTFRDVTVWLYDRRGGADVLQLPPGEERVRSRGEPYLKREPFTAVYSDDYAPDTGPPGRLPRPEPGRDEVERLARVFRHASDLSEYVHVVHPGPLPPAAEAFDGVDHFVLGSGRLAVDPAGLQALRRWLGRGGRLWVLLDQVGPEVLAPLLGDAFDFAVVDRVSLTDFKIEPRAAGPRDPPPEGQRHERPVEFVRVLLPPGESAPHTVNGWPAWFSRRVGDGKVVFTALGPRAWYHPRRRGEPRSRFPNHPTPTEDPALQALAMELRLPLKEDRLPLEAFAAPLAEEIGYSVAGRGTVGLVFGAFLLAALGLGYALGRSRRPELRGWLGPAAALAAAGAFVGLGVAARRGATPTVAVGQVVHASPGVPEASVLGLLALYRPESGEVRAGAAQGGLFELDMEGAEGQTRRLILTDLGAWHWENLELPAGVRYARFRTTAATGRPVTATATFGPDGLEGKLEAGPFADAADALLYSPAARQLAVRLRPDGTFRAGSADALPAGQPLAGGLLSDRQQRRQAFYREYLKKPRRLPTGPTLMAWAGPADTHFALAEGARAVGDALLVVPLRLERPAAGRRVTVPGPLVAVRRLLDEGPAHLTWESPAAADMLLRFQLPPAVLPFRVERARLSARFAAPGRRVTVSGRDGAKSVEFFAADSPLDPLRVEITEPRFLALDKGGGLLLNLAVGAAAPAPAAGGLPAAPPEKWTLEYLELEVTGTVEEAPTAR